MTNDLMIQPVAFTLRPDLIFPSLYVLPFPPGWEDPLRALQAQHSGRESLANTIPIRPLNRVLEALVPGLLTVPRPVRSAETDQKGGRHPEPWLVAPEPIDTGKLWMVIGAWLELSFRDCETYTDLYRQIGEGALTWERLEQALMESPAPNGTARPARIAYSVLPSLLAARLSAREVMIPIFGQQRQLKRIPTEQGAQLVTWPPVEYPDDEGEKWPFSYTITLTLQTLPGNPEPRLHVHYGVRRWIQRSMMRDGSFVARPRASVYLQTTRSWMGLPSPQAFTIARLEARYANDEQRFAAWGDLVPDIAQRVFVDLPAAEKLAAEPWRWLNGVDGIVAAVAYKSPRAHPVQPGLDFTVNEELTDHIAEMLTPEIELAEPLRKLVPVVNTEKHPLTKPLRELPVEERLAALAASVGRNVTIEVWWETEAARDMLIDRIRAVLEQPLPPLVERLRADGTPMPRRRAEEQPPVQAPESLEISLPEGGRLRLFTYKLGDLGAPYPAAERTLRRQERAAFRKRETEKRAKEVSWRLTELSKVRGDDPDEPVLALVELPNYRDLRQPELRKQFGILRDSKPAVRLGFSWAGRVTKFTTGETRQLRRRCENTVLGGLRYLGYLPAPIGYQPQDGTTVPEDLLVVGVWMVRLTRRRGFVKVHLPVVILTRTTERRVLAWAPGLSEAIPYRQVLQHIAKMDPKIVARRRQQEALTELRLFVQGLTARHPNVVLLAVAQNARSTWTGLQNEGLAEDMLRWNRNDPAVPVAGSRGRLRLIRLRTSDSYETPRWYRPGVERGSEGFHQGVWEEPTTPRLFYNTGSKPNTMKGARTGKQRRADEYYALPSLLEVLPIVLQPGDDPADWAQAVDQWRRMSFLTNDMTLFPMVLDWASHVDAYATVIGPWLLDEWEEEVNDEEDLEDFDDTMPDEDDEDFEDEEDLEGNDEATARQLKLDLDASESRNVEDVS
jgi:hypothetical protein